MFLLYVNDIGAKVSPQISIKWFDDDCQLYRAINRDADERQIQHDWIVQYMVNEVQCC